MTRTAAADPLAIADQVLELLRERAPSAEGEVNVRTGTSALTRFANSFIHQNVEEEMSHVGLRVAVDGRTAASRLDGQADDAALARLIDGVLDAARVRPEDPDWPGVSAPEDVPDVDHWDEATASAEPDDRARRVAEFVAAGGGLEAAGSCSTSASLAAFANTAGQRVKGRSTAAVLDGIFRTGTSDGSARGGSVRLSDVDGRSIGERAARKAREGADPTDLEPGRYEVVLEPGCVSNLLLFLFLYGFNGRAVEEGRSFVRIGETQFDPAITLRDDATAARQTGVAFDAEGTPKRPIDLIRAGVTTGVLHTRRTAAKAGAAATGHAIEGAEEWGAIPSNVDLAPGDRTTEELIASITRGLLVTDFWYTRILDPRTQVVTGLTRNGVWLVEDGRIVRPVKNLRFTQSFQEALAPGAVLGISSERTLGVEALEGSYLVPSLHLASWNFTGGAAG